MLHLVLLFLWRSRTGLAKLDTIVFRIINVSWESQALPMAFALIACILFFAKVRWPLVESACSLTN